MLNIGTKTFRNLPEQVAYITAQINKIWGELDGLHVYDNVLVLEDLDPLTPEQLEVVVKPVAFITYNNDVYMKRGSSGSNIYFDKVYNVSESLGTITFSSAEIVVNYDLATLTLNSASITTYTTIQITSLLNDKADKATTYTKTEVDNLLGAIPLSAIVDASNNARFIEGVGTPNSPLASAVVTYNKWSLSGTHLMFVLGLKIESSIGTISFSGGSNILSYSDLPTWIKDKLIPLSGTSNGGIAGAKLQATNSYGQGVGSSGDVALYKYNNNVFVQTSAGFTIGQAGQETYVRLEFDLLIDQA